MTQLLLHIGGEKTGTTALQAFLRRNAAMLLQRHGILYPTASPLALDNGHFPVASAFVEPTECEFVPPASRLTPAETAAALADLVRKHTARLVVLSAEHLSSRLLRPGIERLAEAIGPLPTRIIYYVRRQDELALSAHGTGLRSGVRNWLDPSAISPHTRYFNHLAVADDWAAVFGRENLELRSFDRLTGGIEADFLGAIGAARGDAAPVTRRNERLTLQEATVLHALNQHLPDPTSVWAGRHDEFERGYRVRSRLLSLAREELGPGTPLGGLLTPEQRQRIMTAFAATNRELAERYGVEIPDEIPTASNLPNAEIDRADLLAAVLARAGHELLDLEARMAAVEARTLKGRLRSAKAGLKRYLQPG